MNFPLKPNNNLVYGQDNKKSTTNEFEIINKIIKVI